MPSSVVISPPPCADLEPRLNSVISGLTKQPGAEGQHQNSGAEHQQLRACCDLESHHGFEGGHDQGHHDHLGELLFGSIQRLDVQQVAPNVRRLLLAWINV